MLQNTVSPKCNETLSLLAMEGNGVESTELASGEGLGVGTAIGKIPSPGFCRHGFATGDSGEAETTDHSLVDRDPSGINQCRAGVPEGREPVRITDHRPVRVPVDDARVQESSRHKEVLAIEP